MNENERLRTNIHDPKRRENLNTIWALAETELHPFQKGVTAQDSNHCLRVEANIWSLAFPHIDKFSDEDLFLLSVSSALHDIGKISEDGGKGHKDHGEIAAEWLLSEGNWRKCHIESKVEAESIAHIIRVHASGKIDQIPEQFVIGNPPGVNLRSLAALFRLADMLDSDFRRCPDIARSLKPLKLSKEIEATWVARSTFEGWDKSTDGKTVLLIASPENEEQRIAALGCIDFLNKSLTDSHKANLANFRANYWAENQLREAILHFPTQFSMVEHNGPNLVEKGGLAKFYAEVAEKYRKKLSDDFANVRLRGIGDFTERKTVNLSKVFIDVPATLASGWAPKTYREFDDAVVNWIQSSLVTNRVPIMDAFKIRKLRRIVLLGEPGSGKSTITQFILLNSPSPEYTCIPFLIAVRDFVSNKETQTTIMDHLSNQVSEILGEPVPPSFVSYWLSKEEAFVIFDGLDEVSSPKEREETRNLIAGFISEFKSPMYLITSRIVGYEEGSFDPDKFLHLLLLDLEKEDVEKFIRNWYTERESNHLDRDASIKGFVEALKDEHVAELARNPLLLTIMALVNRGEADLPKQRAMLYDKCVEAFMISRNRAKDLLTYDENEIRTCHEFLGYWMHTRAEETGGSFAGVYLSELKEALLKDMITRRPELKPIAEEKVQEFIDAARKRVGLLVERSNTIWAFGHRSFQEYFAARYISQNTCGIEQIWAEIGSKIERTHWVEPLKLLAGIFGFTSRKTLQEFVCRIMEEHNKEDVSKKKLFLAGEVAGEVSLSFPLMQQISSETIELLLDTRDTNVFNNCKRILDHFYTNSDLWVFIRNRLKERTKAFSINQSVYLGTAFYRFYSMRQLGDTRIDRILAILT